MNLAWQAGESVRPVHFRNSYTNIVARTIICDGGGHLPVNVFLLPVCSFQKIQFGNMPNIFMWCLFEFLCLKGMLVS